MGHSDLMAFLKLVVKRMAAQRLMALALLVTMAFSIGVLVAGPIYANASQQAILSGQLAQSPVQVKNVRFVVFSGPGFNEGATDSAIRAASRSLPLARIIHQAETLSATVTGPVGTLQAPVAYRDGAFAHIKLEGRAPRAPDEVAISAGVSLGVSANVGDTLFLRSGAKGPVVALHVTAVFNPPPANEFWFGGGTIFPTNNQPHQTGSSSLSPLMVTKPGYDAISQQLGLVGQFTWDAYLNLSVRNFNQIQAIPGQVDAIVNSLRRRPGLLHLTGTTGLGDIIQLAEQRTANLRIPIYLVVFQIGAVALAVLAGVASLTLSRQSFELAVLKSRGFTRKQLLLAQGIESTIAAAAAAPLGLLLGMALARLARSSNGPSVRGSQFPITLTSTAVIAGVGGALVGVALLILVSVPFISRTVLEERQELSREGKPLMSRFPIEIIAGILGLAAFYEVKARGVGPVGETGSIDPLVLLAPTLLLFAASFAVLRLLLWAFRRLDGPIGRARHLSTYLAGRRLGRSASTSFATALLLVLAAGLLVVSTSYRATIIRAHEDIAHQEVGADWKVETDPAPQSLATLQALPPGTTGIFRGEADPVSQLAVPLTVLGVDPSTYPTGGWWRNDYASVPLTQLLRRLDIPAGGLPLPGGTDSLRVSVSVGQGLVGSGLKLVARVETSTGVVRSVDFGTVASTDATMLVRSPGAARLLSIVFVHASQQQPPVRIPIHSLTITAVTPQGDVPVPIGNWQPMLWRSSGGSTSLGSSGDALSADLRSGTGDVAAGVAPADTTLPVLASADVVRALTHNFQADVGGARLSFHVVGVLAGFPGMTTGQPFLIASEAPLYERSERAPEPSIGLVEVWAMGSGDPVAAVRRTGLFVDNASSARDIEATLAQLPQSLAVGMHFTAAAGGVALVIIGVAVGLYFGQRRRRFEFAALRAMGTEPGQTIGALVGEQSVLIGFALVTAFLLGYALLRLMLPYVSKNIGFAFPAVTLVLDWVALGTFGVAVLAATAVGLTLAARALLRVPVTSVLRGEAE